MVGSILVDTAGGTLRLVERYGIEATQAHAGAIGQHALSGILKQVVVLNARDDLVVAHALQTQRGDDAHLGQQKLLAREHASKRYFVGVIHRTHSKRSGHFIHIGSMQTCHPIIPFKHRVVGVVAALLAQFSKRLQRRRTRLGVGKARVAELLVNLIDLAT